MRALIIVAILSASVVGLADATPASSAPRSLTNISPQPLRPALHLLSKERGVQLVFRTDVVADLRTQGASGELTVDEALRQLLAGTGLTYQYLDDQTVTIVPTKIDRASTSSGSSGLQSSTFREQSMSNDAIAIRLAQDETLPRSENIVDGDRKKEVEEIIVTAQKRSERLQDVPVPVTALRAESLVDSNQLRLQDYYSRIPGLNLTFANGGQTVIAVRGVVSNSTGTPTVGIVIDDVPYGASTGLGGGFKSPDADPTDLARIEVLRGPQGTLYGVSSLGGLLKYVTVDPTTDAISGRLQAGTSSIHHGDGLGYNMSGAINVPIGETWAFRASGFTRRDPGYVENIQTTADGVNVVDASGGRLAALWKPSQNLSLKLSALLQENETRAAATEDFGLGDLQQDRFPGTGIYHGKIQAYSAVLKAQLHAAELTSLSGYSVNTVFDTLDFSPLFGTDAPYYEDVKNKKITQEIRLAMPIGRRLDWLVGAFYTDENNDVVQQVQGADATTGIFSPLIKIDFPTTYEEYAAFTNLTFHVTDRFDIQVGGRQSQNKQSYSQVDTGAFFPTPRVQELVHTKANAFTYLLTPQFKISPDVMVYARVASGYRSGGPNIRSTANNAEVGFKPDKTKNYEIGIKADTFDRMLSIDASLYYIDWKDIQMEVIRNGLSFFVNASKARSRGIELSIQARPLKGLTIDAWATVSEAVLTEQFPEGAGRGNPGDKLPFSGSRSGNLSLDQEFSLTTDATGFVGGTFTYVPERGSAIGSIGPSNYASYTKTDLRAGVRYEAWTLNLFANNIADNRGVLGGGFPSGLNYIQPRTVGLSLARNF